MSKEKYQKRIIKRKKKKKASIICFQKENTNKQKSIKDESER